MPLAQASNNQTQHQKVFAEPIAPDAQVQRLLKQMMIIQPSNSTRNGDPVYYEKRSMPQVTRQWEDERSEQLFQQLCQL